MFSLRLMDVLSRSMVTPFFSCTTLPKMLLFLRIFLYNVKIDNCMNFLLVSISDPQLEDILAQVVSEDFSLSIIGFLFWLQN